MPDGYSLWEHVKYNKDKMADEKKKDKGRHAAGTYERQDAYLYGHPDGRKKRFRSPADFFPHLLWLAVDKEDNPDNCSCKLCSPDGDIAASEEVIKASKLELDNKQVKNEPKSAPISTAASRASQPSRVARPMNGRSKEQQADLDPNSRYLYRPGEIAWFANEPAWRLGVIGKRGLMNDLPRYLIQPLSNPLQHQPEEIRDEETSLRPWLAWSVPRTTSVTINDMPFEQVDWASKIKGNTDPYRMRDFVVDGSILAAQMIDASYSLFERKDSLAAPGEVHYNGMFLGGEKIWVGEPVRLRVSNGDIVVLVVHKLIEHKIQGPQGLDRSTVTFVGDKYKFVEMPTHAPWGTFESALPTFALPARMVADLHFRNEVAAKAKVNVWYEWRLLEPAARVDLADIRGRWYDCKTLLPLLRGPAGFEQDIQKGKLGDVGRLMNSRRDPNNFNYLPEQRKKNRKDTLGQSVPSDFMVSRGLNGPAAENIFPEDNKPEPPQPDVDQFMLDPDLENAGLEFFA